VLKPLGISIHQSIYVADRDIDEGARHTGGRDFEATACGLKPVAAVWVDVFFVESGRNHPRDILQSVGGEPNCPFGEQLACHYLDAFCGSLLSQTLRGKVNDEFCGISDVFTDLHSFVEQVDYSFLFRGGTFIDGDLKGLLYHGDVVAFYAFLEEGVLLNSASGVNPDFLLLGAENSFSHGGFGIPHGAITLYFVIADDVGDLHFLRVGIVGQVIAYHHGGGDGAGEVRGDNGVGVKIQDVAGLKQSGGSKGAGLVERDYPANHFSHVCLSGGVSGIAIYGERIFHCCVHTHLRVVPHAVDFRQLHELFDGDGTTTYISA